MQRLKKAYRVSIFLCFFISLCATANVDAAELIRPEALVELAIQNNPELSLSRADLSGAKAAQSLAGVFQNPRVEIGLGRESARAALQDPSSQIQNLSLSQFIENPDLRSARIASFASLSQAQAARVDAARFLIAGLVRRVAYEVLLRQAEIGAADEARALLESTRARVKLRVESGDAARYELIKADAELIGAQQRSQVARLALEQARIRLQQVVGVDLPPGWGIQASLEDPVQVPNRTLVRGQLLTQHPDLMALRAEVRAAAERVNEARASRWPGVDLQVSQLRDRGLDRPARYETLLGASLAVPLLDPRKAAIDLAQAQVQRAELALKAREQSLLREFDSAWAALEIAALRVKSLSEGAIREAESALRVAEAAYRFGERGILDVIDAQRVLRLVRADLLSARFEQQAASIAIRVLTTEATP
ncbi:MAG: TolC family protein [Betaproteobacteria bacterium]|nr:TolC family protein [Betaproteobacteria bacterium]NBP37216.1 TolC family protein [Betaproteobacteria bacterium]NCW25418.1 TolC family protein [Betaproteobacteria bacterium]